MATTLVVINLPRDVDVEALVSRFGAVLRGKSGAAGAQLSPGEVRFTEKPWTVEGVETSVRIAFVDVAGDPRRAAAIMSAYNGSKWYGNRITVQRARRRYYLHTLEEEWREQREQRDRDEDRRHRAAGGDGAAAAAATTAPLRIPGKRGPLTVFIDRQERQKKIRSGQYRNLLLRNERGGGGGGAPAGGPPRRADARAAPSGAAPRAPQRPSGRPAAAGAARAAPPARRRSRLDEEEWELKGDSDEEYTDTEEGERRHGEEMHTEEAIAAERSQHLRILEKLGIAPRRARPADPSPAPEPAPPADGKAVVRAIEEADEFEMNVGMAPESNLEALISRMSRDRT